MNVALTANEKIAHPDAVDMPEDIIQSLISMIEMLSDENRKKLLIFSMELLNDERMADEKDSPFRPKSEGELLERIDRGLAQAKNGEYADVDAVCDEIIVELGL